MASYVSKSACRGHQPLRLASRRLYRRPAITARLLRERSVARFLVAPRGYGKTCIAAEYAETVFDFKHVFWFACESPCFIRDLDNDALLSGVLDVDAQPQLVVFDDLPMLDDKRSAQFSLVIDAFIDIGCEVLVCCTPSADSMAQLQRDRICLGAGDMLLTDAELSNVAGLPVRAPVEDGPLKHVCAIGWCASGEDALPDFLKGLAKEELPSDIALAVFAMTVLEEGSFSDVSHIGRFDTESIAFLERGYPHLGIDVLGERFTAKGFAIDDIATAFRLKIEGLAQSSRFVERDAFASCLADLLFKGGKYARACRVAQCFCSQRARASWLIEKDMPLVEKGCVLPSLDAFDSLGDAGAAASRVALARARRFVLLADVKQAVMAAARAAFDSSADESCRMQALVIVARNAETALARRATDEMHSLLAGAGEDPAAFDDASGAFAGGAADFCDSGNPRASAAGKLVGTGESGGFSASVEPCAAPSDAAYKEPDVYWVPLGQLCLASFGGVGAAFDAWVRARRRGASDSVLLTAASWLFGMFAEGKGSFADCVDKLEELALFVLDKLRPENLGFCGISAASAGLAFERARMARLPLPGGSLQPETMFWLRDVEMGVLRQRRAYDARRREKVDRFADRLLTHPDSYLAADAGGAAGLSRMAPLLEVKLFGGMEVRLNGERVDSTRISRDKVKTLLAILVLARGREMERDALVRSLWPESTLDGARRNFYTIWSQLRDALELPDGTCPYLIRRKGACSIDARLVRSDVKRFDALCRELRFGAVSDENAREIYRQIEEEFSSELLPGEQKNEIIIAAREDCKAQFLDALINGSANLVRMGDGHQAMWLARSAVRKDNLREDAYQALMNAQIAIGQRTAALMTYLKCKKILSEQLGLDPSPDMEAMYQQLLDPVEVVAAKA